MNPFDQFDAPVSGPAPAASAAPDMNAGASAPAAAVANPFDQFDAPAAAPLTGPLPNIAAGAQMGAAGALNILADPVHELLERPVNTVATGAYNLGARMFGYDPLTADQTDAAANSHWGLARSLYSDPTLHDPNPGQTLIDRGDRVAGLHTPSEVAESGALDRYLRAGAQGAVGMALMGPLGEVGSVPRAIGAVAKQAGVGVLSGVGSQVAADVAPDDLKPLASLVGGIVAPGAASVSSAIAQGAMRPIINGLLDYAAPGVGKPNALLDAAGAPIADATGVPVVASANQARMAGQRIEAAASDSQAVRQVLANPPPPLVPGVQPTTFQVTRDPGLGSLELGASQGAGAPAFRSQADKANDARVAMLQGIAPEASPAAVPAALQRTAGDIDAIQTGQVQNAQANAAALTARAQAEHDATVARLQANAGQTLDAVGGNLPAGSDGTVGAALRAPVDAARQASAMVKSRAWDAIDPDGTQAVSMQPISAGAKDIIAKMSPNDDDLQGKEAGIFQTAVNLPAVQSFQDLRALRSRVTTAISQERSNPQGDPQTVRRLGLLLGHVQTALDGAAEPAASGSLAGASGGAVGEASANPFNRFDAASPASGAVDPAAAAPALGNSVFTPSGQKVDVRYRVREAGDLVPSQLADGRDNPAFPPALQPRDRTRAASLDQVNTIASRLEPERLGASASTAEGAPIVGPDGVVESGNGRTLAIQQAYAQGGERAQAYREFLQKQGYDTANMKAPVLVRERTTPLDDAARAKFADDAGASPVLGMSASERAAADSKRLSDDTLRMWRGGEVGDASNANFVRAFVQEALPESERAGFVTSDGKLSAEGAARVRNALTQRAYGSNTLVSSLAEHADENVRAFGGALADAAGPMAKLRAAIDTGMADKASDLSPALVEAAGMVQQARKSGIALRDAVGQQDAFSQRNPLTGAILRAAYGSDFSGRMSRVRLTNLLSHYADEAQVQGGLFGQNRRSDEILGEATQRYGYGTQGTGRAGSVERVGRDGSSAGQDGNAARGPDAGAGGQGDAGAGRGNGAVLPGVPLTANFDRGAATRYALARAATVRHATTFKDAPGVGQVLQQGKFSGDFRTPDSAVPNIIVKTGSQGADVARAYLAAGGSPQALTDAAAFSLRQAAMSPDGTLDPARYNAWARDRSAFLSQIPDAAARFGDAASASQALREGVKPAAQTLQQATKLAEQTVKEATARRADAIKEYQDSVAGKLLSGDPVAQVGTILRDKAMGEANMAHLARLTENDPDARAGLQRAVVEHILTELKGNARGAESQEGYLKSDQFQTLIRTREATLRQVLSPEQIGSLKAVADSLEQSNLSVAGNKVAGGSPTAQKLSAAIAAKHMNLLQRFTHEWMGAALGAGTGASIGSAIAGSYGATIGSTLGTAFGKTLQDARNAGIKNVDDLVTQAMLNPALARVLLAKVTPQNQVSLVTALRNQLGRLSLVSAARGSQAPSGQGNDSRRGFVGVQANNVPNNALMSLAHGAPLPPMPQNGLLASIGPR